MIEIKGDITFVTHGIICQQVNTKGVMGAGLAFQLKTKWPVIYADYDLAYRRQELRLGSVVYTNIVQKDFKLQVASLCAQLDYGNVKGMRYTSYKAFAECLEKLVIWHAACLQGKLPVYFPYKIGCGLAGGEWAVVKPLIEEHFPNAIIIKKPKFSRI